jgi:hypothetical protein
MDARRFRLAVLVPALLFFGALSSQGATFSTANFVVTTGDPDFARQCAETAERYRAQLAREWLGKDIPRWFRPCQVSVTVGQIGAGGATTFTFAAGQVFGWNMKVQGTPERILDSVIPHEVSHTIFASYFRRPLPRWADEGAASLVEHESERRRQSLLLQQVFNTPQRIPLTTLISMKEYPGDMQAVLTLYAEGYSLADYLVQSGGETGKERYLRFLQDAHERDWNHAIRTWYGLPDVTSLERRWSNWVALGSPDIRESDNSRIAQADAQEMRKKGIIVRSQSPDNPPTSVRRPPLSDSAAAANATASGDELQAPAPVARTAKPYARTAENAENVEPVTDVALANDRAVDRAAERAAEHRREGRERMLREGWEAIPAAEPAPRVRANGSQNTNQTVSSETEANDSAESAPRRRFRNAKQQHDVEPAAAATEAEDPFAETRTAPSYSDVAHAESPFHTEN